MNQCDFFNQSTGQRCAVTIPVADLFDLYEVMEELAQVKAAEVNKPSSFNHHEYLLILQHCFNAWARQDYPCDLDFDVSEYLEGIIANFDIIHLDHFIEQRFSFFPPGVRSVRYVALRDNMTVWETQL